MLELRLIMFGIPKMELNTMTSKEIQVLVHLISYMNREEHGDEV
mgnify:CR=1 FL=1|jgi:hypothetical protein